jgi:hypothetical protein
MGTVTTRLLKRPSPTWLSFGGRLEEVLERCTDHVWAEGE